MALSTAQAVSLEALRTRIRELEGARVHTRRTPSGVPLIDELVEGLPRPGLMDVHGAPGCGRTRLALALVRRQPVAAWVDFERSLYPPAVQALGVDLSRLLLLHPPAGRGIWAVEQLLRAGCLPLVIASSPPHLHRAGQRWALAAEAGRCTGIVLRERPSRDVPAQVRLRVGDGRVTVVRNQHGTIGRSTEWVATSR